MAKNHFSRGEAPEVSFWGFWGLVCVKKWHQISNTNPFIKINFFGVKLFFPGFLMYRPSWIQSILLIRPILTLGPRPNDDVKDD